MPAKSKAQQRFFGMVDAYQKGDMKNASKSIKKAADSMSRKEVKKFAKTKRKGLPEKVDESMINKALRESLNNLLKESEEPNENEIPDGIGLHLWEISDELYKLSEKLNDETGLLRKAGHAIDNYLFELMKKGMK